jgi:hypothetical protein
MLAVAVIAVLGALGFEIDRCLGRRRECLYEAEQHTRRSNSVQRSVWRSDKLLIRVEALKKSYIYGDKLQEEQIDLLVRASRGQSEADRKLLAYHERQAKRYARVAARPWLAMPEPEPEPEDYKLPELPTGPLPPADELSAVATPLPGSPDSDGLPALPPGAPRIAPARSGGEPAEPPDDR